MRAVTTPGLTLEPQVAAHAIYEHESAPPASLEWLREPVLGRRVAADELLMVRNINRTPRGAP
jgi:hypothetical protein